MTSPVVHFEIMGKDARKLEEFYREVFGWKVEDVMPGYALAYTRDGNGIDGGIGATPEGNTSYVTVYAEVPDLQEAIDRVKAHGGQVVMEPTNVPEGPSIAMFADPEGHLFGLIKAGSGRQQ